jgi:phosphoserine aminotransferase
MNNLGLANLRRELDVKADMIYDFAKQHKDFEPLVKVEAHRSKTVAVLHTDRPSAAIIAAVEQHHMRIGSGYGKNKASQIRIANFPATSIQQMEELLDVLNTL